MSQMTAMNAMNADPRLPGSQAYRDGLGVAASVLCAIHCAAMPFVVGFLPLLGLGFLEVTYTWAREQPESERRTTREKSACRKEQAVF